MGEGGAINMAKLKDVARERFVQKYLANGQNGQNAYMAAFPKCTISAARACAPRLLRYPDVQRRLAEIRNQSARRTEITLDLLITEASDIQYKALAKKSYAAAIAALIAKAKLAGFWVERTHGESFNVHYAVGDKPLSEEDWLRQHVTAY
jgi:hypothetical protein